MKPDTIVADELLPTRHSLLSRLKRREDQQAWQEFFDRYWRLIYRVAIKAGLSDAEAQDVVQETIITVSKHIGDFETDPARGSFKAWLLKTTRWRILDQLDKRRPDQVARAHRLPDDTRATATLERIPDPSADLDRHWDAEWRQQEISIALERLKGKVHPRHYQIFYLYAVRESPPSEVAQTLGVTTAQVYLVKHRLTPRFKAELERVERDLG